MGADCAGAGEPNEKDAPGAGVGAGVDPNEKGAGEGAPGVGAGAGVDPKTGIGVDPKLGVEVGAVLPEAARELFEAFPNEEGAFEVPKPDALIDELSSFVEFAGRLPNTKGAIAPSGFDTKAGAPPDSNEATGASLDGLEQNDTLG